MSERLGFDEAHERARQQKIKAEQLELEKSLASGKEMREAPSTRAYELADKIIDFWKQAEREPDEEQETPEPNQKADIEGQLTEEEINSEVLNWEILPIKEWPEVEAAIKKEIGSPRGKNYDIERINNLVNLAKSWEDQGGSLGIHQFAGTDRVYVAAFRRRELKDGRVVEDAVVDCGELKNAVYALRGDEGDPGEEINWRRLFCNDKEIVRVIFDMENIGRRIYHRGEGWKGRILEYLD